MNSKTVSTEPIWLGVGSPKPQSRVKQNSMFGHVVDAFDEKTIVKIGEISPYERRMRAKAEGEKRQREMEERAAAGETPQDAPPTPACLDGRDGSRKEDGDSCVDGGGEGSNEEVIEQGGSSGLIAGVAKDTMFSDMSNCLLIKGGKIINDDHSAIADVLIKDGKICSIGKNMEIPGGVETLNGEGKYILPGGIDLNTHFELTHLNCKSVDDFETGTKAAIHGGTTLIADCVVPEIDQSYLEAYENWVKKAEKSLCDYVLRVAIPWWSEGGEKEIETLVNEKGVNVFVLLANSKFSDVDLYKIFNKLKQLGCLLQVHPGDSILLAQKADEIFAEGVIGPEGYLLASPEEIETMAIYKYVTLADHIGLPLYITTITSKAAAELVAKKRKEGKVVFGEVAVASIAVDGSKILDADWTISAGHVTKPPIRTQKNNASCLVDLLANGDLQVVSSDHRSFNTDQRAIGRNDFRLIFPGVAAVQERLEVIWNVAVSTGRMDPCRFVSVTSSFPAKLLNLYPQKGRIAVGSDADLLIFDPDKEGECGLEGRQSKSDFNVFEGFKLRGRVSAVIKSGVAVLGGGSNEVKVDLKPGSLMTCKPGIEVGFEKLKLKEKVFSEMKPIERESYMGPISGIDDVNSSRAPSHAAGTRSGGDLPFCRPPTRSGGRNMQDTTLSISVEGTYADDPIKCQKLGGYRVNQPPGGRSTQFW